MDKVLICFIVFGGELGLCNMAIYRLSLFLWPLLCHAVSFLGRKPHTVYAACDQVDESNSALNISRLANIPPCALQVKQATSRSHLFNYSIIFYLGSE